MATRTLEHWWNGRTGPGQKDLWLRVNGQLWHIVAREGGPDRTRHVWPVNGGETEARIWLDRFKAGSGDPPEAWRLVIPQRASGGH